MTNTQATAPVAHTWHASTFGLLYGKTTKTACNRRVPTAKLVGRMQTTCPDCQSAVIADMQADNDMHTAANEIAQSQGYAGVTDWADQNRPLVVAMCVPNKYRTPEQREIIRHNGETR